MLLLMLLLLLLQLLFYGNAFVGTLVAVVVPDFIVLLLSTAFV